ncbi:hypothetical protein Pmani_021762 [Petrolisthes manimaculis]|uniref:Uncharacterized protein n=1 Tax=Petrolisthes manimaculis TaxID=1843537 RepID=A0AAE1PD57_9EUCA|nr:hypothetical protein Pmani_021762 [Petrolisthes manimaculis]
MDDNCHQHIPRCQTMPGQHHPPEPPRLPHTTRPLFNLHRYIQQTLLELSYNKHLETLQWKYNAFDN